MGGFFPGQLLYGVTEAGLLISIRVGEEGNLVPPRLPGEIEFKLSEID
jgi:hypothetical protein